MKGAILMAEKTVPTTVSEDPQAPVTRDDTRHLAPPVDIYETAEGLSVVVDLPGVEKDDLGIRVDNGVLTISGKPKRNTVGESIYQEFDLLNFFRQFELPDEVDQEKIEAHLSGGVLNLKLPKVEKAKPKQITVKVN